MRLPIALALALAALAIALPAAPAGAADCADKRLDFTGSAREADFTGGGGMFGPRKLDVGEPVEDGKLKGGQTYFVPAGKSLKVEIGGYTYRVGERGVFIPQCDFGSSKVYFRLLERKVSVSGPSFSGNPKGYVITPEAQFLPLPGKPNYTVSRTVTDSRKTTRSRVSAARTSPGMFVKASSVVGKKIPCQGGKAVTIFLDGHYRNG